MLTIPKSLRQAYSLKPGDEFTLLDLGGVFVLTPLRLQVDALAEQISQALLVKGESLESMLKALREARQDYGE